MGETMMETYPSDLSDEEWGLIEPFVEYKGGSVGRPREINTRNVVDAIFYLNKTGCQWRYLPKKYPAWKDVHKYFSKWRNNGTWQKINDVFRERLREAEGKEKGPSASIVDSQSVKTVQFGAQRGYDAGKKNQRKEKAHCS
jgi:putative transposase